MQIEKPKNQNYCATIVEIKIIKPLENCDNVVATLLFGYQAIVTKDTKVGDIGVLFTTETQLSDNFCYHNNLYRHGERNANQTEKGYLEDNRRIRAIRFRGHTSNCLFMPLKSLSFLSSNISELKVGDEFDTLNGVEICKKYEVYRKQQNQAKGSQKRTHSRVDPKHIPEHISSSNFFKYGDVFSPEDDVVVTQKLHGTSVRVGNIPVERKLSLWERFLAKCGVGVQLTQFDYIYGSRKVIKDINNPFHKHFYSYDLWSDVGMRDFKDKLPENYVVYAEILGYTKDGGVIQKGYTYCIPMRESKVYVYRIAVVNAEGVSVDLSWDQLKDFCTQRGFSYVPEIWRGKVKDMDAMQWVDKRLFDTYRNCLSLGEDQNLVDEGVCIRRDGIIPTILKAKSPKFYEHETSLLDKGEIDLESSQTLE